MSEVAIITDKYDAQIARVIVARQRYLDNFQKFCDEVKTTFREAPADKKQCITCDKLISCIENLDASMISIYEVVEASVRSNKEEAQRSANLFQMYINSLSTLKNAKETQEKLVKKVDDLLLESEKKDGEKIAMMDLLKDMRAKLEEVSTAYQHTLPAVAREHNLAIRKLLDLAVKLTEEERGGLSVLAGKMLSDPTATNRTRKDGNGAVYDYFSMQLIAQSIRAVKEEARQEALYEIYQAVFGEDIRTLI